MFPPYYRPPVFGHLAALAGVRYVPLTTARPTMSEADVAAADPRVAAGLSLNWDRLRMPAVTRQCEGGGAPGTSHPSHADAPGLSGTSSCAALGKRAAADVDFAVLGAVLRRELRLQQRRRALAAGGEPARETVTRQAH